MIINIHLLIKAVINTNQFDDTFLKIAGETMV